MKRSASAVTAMLSVSVVSEALAHSGYLEPTTLRSWSWEPGVIAGLAVTGWLYARGLRRLRAATRVTEKFQREAFYFWSGWLLLVIALVSPLHPWGQELFSAHMTQHELLMIGAAPLLILGRPAVVMLWAGSRSTIQELMQWKQALALDQAHDWLIRPFIAWVIHVAALWIWHVPALFQSTLDSELSHALQHLSFLGTALLFWQAVLRGPQRRMGYGVGVLYLFATVVQTGALGALITFSSHLWYPRYGDRAMAWGLTPLTDQQLGGLIMWVPGGLIYVMAGLVLFARWLEEAGERAVRSPHSPISPS